MLSKLFSQQTDEPQDAGVPTTVDSDHAVIKAAVIEALKTVHDPEIPVNIYDLGLIYDITINTDNDVSLTMTLTTPACPVAMSMPGQVEKTVEAVDAVRNVKVDLVWDPPWTRERMSEEARLALGMY